MDTTAKRIRPPVLGCGKDDIKFARVLEIRDRRAIVIPKVSSIDPFGATSGIEDI
jgi:hypothetical protein